MPEIILEHISKRYRGEGGLDDVSFTIYDGEYFTLLGNTGGGKTTLLHIIAGLVRPDSGRVLVNGIDITKKHPYERNLGLVFENYALFPHMTVNDNINYSHRVRGKDPEETQRIGEDILNMLRLFNRGGAWPSELSGGMQQRVALGRALMNMEQTGILLLDEPFKALDAGLRMNLRFEIRNLAKSDLKLTVIHITNDMTEAMMVSDRIALVRDGKIVQVGTPKEMYYQPTSLFAAYFFSDTVYFRGEVASGADSSYDVTVAKNVAFKVENPIQKYQTGDAVVLVVRNDYFKIYTEPVSPEDNDNILEGKVVGVKFMGPFIRFTVNLAIGNVIAIDIPSTYGVMEKFPEGQKVWLTFNPTKAFLFPDPGEEKLKELYFEI